MREIKVSFRNGELYKDFEIDPVGAESVVEVAVSEDLGAYRSVGGRVGRVSANRRRK